MRLTDQGTRRTVRDALTAVDTTRNVESFVKCCSNDCFGTAVDEVDTGNSLNFIADPNTFSAFNTLFRVSNNGFTGSIAGKRAFLTDEPAMPDSERIGKCLKLATTVPFAEQAVVGMIGKKKLNNHSPGFNGSVGMGLDFHPGGDGKSTTWNESALSFDFNDADSARSGGGETFIMTESRNVNSDAPQSFEQGFAGYGINLPVINFNLYGVGWSGHDHSERVRRTEPASILPKTAAER
jgi:hypothetical protein